jgi:spore coat polysaccharide biosynthesis protein SpsF
MKTVACIIARTNSRRLTKKVLKELNGKCLIEHIIEKIRRCQLVDEIFLCTSIDSDDKILLEIAEKCGIQSHAGDPNNVLERMLSVGELTGADNLVRITGDNLFTDEVYIDLMIDIHGKEAFDYTRTEYLPLGVTAEVMSYESLFRCSERINPQYSQYLMIYMFDPYANRCGVLVPPEKHRQPLSSLTIDTLDDWGRARKLVGERSSIPNYHALIEQTSFMSEEIFRFEAGGRIKLPAGVCVSYQTYRVEMEERVQLSELCEVTLEDYFHAIPK